jgi:hypothetical protein
VVRLFADDAGHRYFAVGKQARLITSTEAKMTMTGLAKPQMPSSPARHRPARASIWGRVKGAGS